MRSLFAATFFVIAALCWVPESLAKVTPWEEAQALADRVISEAEAKGLSAIEPYAATMAKLLAGAKDATALAMASGIVLTDGGADTLAKLTIAATEKNDMTAVDNPYPRLALYLGSYLNEIHQPSEALATLDTGIALDDPNHLGLADMLPVLLSERGAAFVLLKDFEEALASYDKGLELTGVEDRKRARLYRGRGYALIELGRLDDAQMAYEKSLTCDADNPGALSELKYIEEVRKGRAPSPGQIVVPPPRKEAESTGHCATD